MKPILKVFLMAAASLLFLTGCGEDDGGKMAGTYLSNDKDKMVLEYKKPDYSLSFIAYDNFADSLGKKGIYSKPKNLGVIKKDGDFLVKSDETKEKLFEIKNGGKEIVTLYTSTKKTYTKASE